MDTQVVTIEQYREVLSLYLGLFEEIAEKKLDLIEKDNFDNYRHCVKEANRVRSEARGFYNPTGILMQLEDIETELPW